MAPAIQKKYATATAARSAFKSVLDASERGRTVTVVRDDYVAAIVAADRLQDYFARTVSPHAKAFFEDGLWVVLLENRPFVSEGVSLDDAVADLIESLREYAEDWEERLQSAPNHAGNWGFVQLITLSTDDQLANWLNTAS